MLEPATAPWGLRISDADFKKLSAGFEPEDMDDKFRVSVFDQSQSGNVSIHVIRVTGERELYVLFVNPNNGGNSNGGVIIEAITWEQNKGGIRLSEEQAKKEVVMITRSMLQCDYDALPAYDSEEMFNHPGARIGANNGNGVQIGAGAYTSPKAGAWFAGPAYQHCIIRAEPNAWNKVPRVWIPEFDCGGKKLWGDKPD